MRKNLETPGTYFQMRRISQITDSHCGPAVIQMLLSNIGIDVTQDSIAQSGGAGDLIELHGMRVDQMEKAVKALAPQAQFWYKENATLKDVDQLVRKHKYPVGVEWQGIFDEEGNEAEDPEPDYGHYSVITHIDHDKNELIIVDPYKHYVLQDRIFELAEFDVRWWDYNMAPDPRTGKSSLKKDEHMLFIITPNHVTFPAQLGLIKA